MCQGLVGILRFDDMKVKSDPKGSLLVLKRSLELDLEMKTALHARSTDLNSRTIRNTCPLEVWVLAAVAGWVELGSTNRVRVLSNYF